MSDVTEPLIRVRAAVAKAEAQATPEARRRWVHRHTGKHPDEFTADELAAHHLQCDQARVATVEPGDVIALCRVVPSPSAIVQDIQLGCVRAAEAKEVHIGVRHLRHILDSLPPSAIPAPTPVPAPAPTEAAAAEPA
jgi:hypothetical protein